MGGRKAHHWTLYRNLASKIEADLKRRGIDCHNYLSTPEGMAVKEWCTHPVVIVSGEQVDKLEEWRDMYANGTLLIDEFGTLASSFGGETIKWPDTTMTVLKDLASAGDHTILMDAGGMSERVAANNGFICLNWHITNLTHHL